MKALRYFLPSLLLTVLGVVLLLGFLGPKPYLLEQLASFLDSMIGSHSDWAINQPLIPITPEGLANEGSELIGKIHTDYSYTVISRPLLGLAGMILLLSPGIIHAILAVENYKKEPFQISR